MSQFMRRTKCAEGSSSGSLKWQDSEFASTYPALSEFIGDPSFSDGESRQPGTLLMFCDGTLLKGCLTDREQNLTAFFTNSSWDGLLEAMEAGLVDGTADWRTKKEYRKSK